MTVKHAAAEWMCNVQHGTCMVWLAKGCPDDEVLPPVQKMQAFLEGCKLEYCEGKKAGFGMDKRTGEKFKKVGGKRCY